MITPADLRGPHLFDGLSDDQLADMISQSEEVAFEPEDEVWQAGEHADFWWILVEGTVDLVRTTGGVETIVGQFDRPGRWAGGFRAWDPDGVYLATPRATTSGRFLKVPAPVLRDIVAGYPLVTPLIRGLFTTARNIEAGARQREALAALGTLSAGLAHELNNPAAAATRTVDALAEAMSDVLEALERMAQEGVDSGQYSALDRLRREVQAPVSRVDALALADHEEELAEWIEDHGVDRAWLLGPALAAAGVDLAWCERVADILPGSGLGPSLDWVASTITVASLLDQIKDSTRRISELVAAVRSYSQMDRAAMRSIDLTEGLEATLVMLQHRIGAAVRIERDYEPGLPEVEAFAGELNQVWTNLITNAVDAMAGDGTLRLTTRSSSDHVIVEVTDSGHGMAPEVARRAFEAFFTTKDVGSGTGLGLDIARRIVVQRHGGLIDIESEPGRTIIRVSLPRRAVQ